MSGGIPKRITRMKTGIGYKPISGRWGLQGLETCARRNKVLCQYVKRRTAKLGLVWSFGSTLNDFNFLTAIDWWFGIPLSRKYEVPPNSRQIIVSIFGQIVDWKTVGVKNMANAFSASRNPKAATFNEDISGDGLVNGKWDTTNVTTMENMFKGAAAFNQNIMGWNTQLVENMSGMFNGATNFNNGGSASGWINLASVTDMSSMFKGASSFNSNILGAGKWVTSAVTSMDSMFEGAISFTNGIALVALKVSQGAAAGLTTNSMFKNITGNGPTLTVWNPSNVTSMVSMFEGARGFHQDISVWNTSAVTSMASMFKGAKSFNYNILGAGKWDTSAVTSMDSMFEGAISFTNGIALVALKASQGAAAGLTTNSMFKNITDTGPTLTVWDPTNVTSMASMFEGATAFDQDISSWTTTAVTSMDSMFKGATSFDQDIRLWNVSVVASSTNVFSGATTMLANYNYTTGTTSKVADTTPTEMNVQKYKFFKYPIATNADLTSKVTAFFNNPTTSLNNVGLIGNWNIGVVTSLNSTFTDKITFNEDLSEWNTSAVTTMFQMFKGATLFNSHIQKKGPQWDTGNVVQMTHMFNDAAAFHQDISNWTVNGTMTAPDVFEMVTGASTATGGFHCDYLPAAIIALGGTGCVTAQNWPTALYGTTLDNNNYLYAIDWYLGTGDFKAGVILQFGPIADWDMSGNNDLTNAFKNGRTRIQGGLLNSITFNEDITAWNTTIVESMMGTFQGATLFNQNILGTGQWNTLNVESMESMFEEANGFLNAGQPFAETLGSDPGFLIADSMFKNITGAGPPLHTIWKPSNVKSMASMFEGATAFNQNIVNWDTSNVTSMDSMFKGAVAFNFEILASIKWDTSAVTSMDSMFENTTVFNNGGNVITGLRGASAGLTTNSMFQGAGPDLPNLEGWVPSNVTSMKNMFKGATAFDQDIKAWDITGLKANGLNGIFNGASVFDRNLSVWNTTNVFTDQPDHNFPKNIFIGASLAANGDWSGSPGNWITNLNNVAAVIHGFYVSGVSYPSGGPPSATELPKLIV